MTANVRLIHGRPYIRTSHVCDLCDIDDVEFARMCFDDRSPSVSITRVGAAVYVDASSCRVLLHAWMPEKVSYFDNYFTTTKRTLTPAEKKTVAMRQRWTCKRCQCLLKDFEVDHVEQRCIRNQNTWLQALCPNCHRTKTREDRLFGDSLFEPIVRNVGKAPQTNVFAEYMCV